MTPAKAIVRVASLLFSPFGAVQQAEAKLLSPFLAQASEPLPTPPQSGAEAGAAMGPLEWESMQGTSYSLSTATPTLSCLPLGDPPLLSAGPKGKAGSGNLGALSSQEDIGRDTYKSALGFLES